MYLATGGKKVSEQQLDQNEEIEVLKIPVDDVVELLHENAFLQSMHTVAIYQALRKLGKVT